MKAFTGFRSYGDVILKDYGTEFPSSPSVGQLAMVDGVLYMYSQVDSVLAWRPLTKRNQWYKYIQPSGATTWVIQHNLNTTDVLLECYDNNGDSVEPAYVTFDDVNTITLHFVSDQDGKALVFGLSEGVGGITTNFTQYTENVYNAGNISGTFTVDISKGVIQTATITGVTTITFTGFPLNNRSASVVLMLTNAGSAAITWNSAVKWSGGTAPTLTASGKDRLVFCSDDGGVNIYGFAAGLDMK